LRAALKQSKREAEQAAAELRAIKDDLNRRILASEQRIDALTSENLRAAAEIQAEREAYARALADGREEAHTIAMQRDEALAQVEAERAIRARELEEALREKAAEMEAASKEIAALERELESTRTDRETVARQRDELNRRIGHITEEQTRLLDNLRESTLSDHPQRSIRPPAPKTHVVEMTDSDLVPATPQRIVNLPPARPAPIAPPKVGRL
jgi:septal ring factor EnvC (AmiA/AmiB activator)